MMGTLNTQLHGHVKKKVADDMDYLQFNQQLHLCIELIGVQDGWGVIRRGSITGSWIEGQGPSIAGLKPGGLVPGLRSVQEAPDVVGGSQEEAPHALHHSRDHLQHFSVGLGSSGERRGVSRGCGGGELAGGWVLVMPVPPWDAWGHGMGTGCRRRSWPLQPHCRVGVWGGEVEVPASPSPAR